MKQELISFLDFVLNNNKVFFSLIVIMCFFCILFFVIREIKFLFNYKTKKSYDFVPFSIFFDDESVFEPVEDIKEFFLINLLFLGLSLIESFTIFLLFPYFLLMFTLTLLSIHYYCYIIFFIIFVLILLKIYLYKKFIEKVNEEK